MAFPRTRTIRFRITVVATLVVALVLAATGIVLVVVQRAQLLSNLDSALERRADALEVGDTEPTSTGEDRFEQILDGDGEVVAASPNLVGEPPVVEAPVAPGESYGTVAVPTVDEDEFRVLVLRYATPDGDRVLVVGETADDLRDSVRILTISLLVAIPLVVGSLAALIWSLVGRTLRPVEAIRSEVADISATELHRRVTEPDTGDEVARLADTMNLMLDRLDSSTRLQRQFVADASHELRGPLTRIRTELEVDGTHESVLEEVVSMQRLVEDLLHLARSDAGAASIRRDPVDLDVLVHQEVQRLRAAGVTVDMSEVSGAAVVGHPGHLSRAVRNLIDNAANHARSVVAVSLRESTDRAVLMVDDDGDGIPPQEREHVFERFTRLDQARSRDAGGAGLGLAITHDIVTRLGGTIVISDSPSGGARFTVELPLDGPVRT